MKKIEVAEQKKVNGGGLGDIHFNFNDGFWYGGSALYNPQTQSDRNNAGYNTEPTGVWLWRW